MNLWPINFSRKPLFAPANTVASWQQVTEVSYLLCRAVPFQVSAPQLLYCRIWVNYCPAFSLFTNFVILHNLNTPSCRPFSPSWAALAFLVSVCKTLVNTEQNWSQHQGLGDPNSDCSLPWKVTVTSYPLLPSLYQLSVHKRNFLQVPWQVSWFFESLDTLCPLVPLHTLAYLHHYSAG